MAPGELELFETHDLIEELLRRASFQGVIIHAREGIKSADWEGERVFSVRFNGNLSSEEAGRLLKLVGHHLINGESRPAER